MRYKGAGRPPGGRRGGTNIAPFKANYLTVFFCERAVTRFYWRQHGRYNLLTYPDRHVDRVIRCRGAGGYAAQVVGARLDLVKPFIDAQDACRKNN